MDVKQLITTVVSMALLNTGTKDWNQIIMLIITSIIYQYYATVWSSIKSFIWKKSVINKIKIHSHDDCGQQNIIYASILWYLKDKMKGSTHLGQKDMRYHMHKSTKLPIYDILSSENILDTDGLKYSFETRQNEKTERGEFIINIYGDNLEMMQNKITTINKDYTEYMILITKQESNIPGLKIHLYNDNNWIKKISQINITFDNLFISDLIKQVINVNINKVLNNNEFYKKHAKPQKMSVLLYGKPGCGKTSMYLAIANMYKLPIYIVNSDVITKGKLDFINSIPDKSIIVFEEIDTFGIKNRTDSDSNKDNNKDESKKYLHQILELLDGYYTLPNKSVIILTTNYIDRLDSALLRKGRIDHLIELKHPDSEIIKQIFDYHYTNNNIDQEIFDNLSTKLPTCEYTSTILQNLDDPDKAIKELSVIL